MGTLLRDLRFGARSLLRAPGFAAVAVLSLALGIGANTTIFSVVDALLLRPLAYPAPAGLLAFRQNQSPPDLRDAGAQSRALSKVAGYGSYPLDLAGRGEPEELPGALVSGPLFEALGVRPAEGRWLAPEDDRGFAVVLSHGLRRRLFGDTPALGASLSLSGKAFTVVGVMPPGFRLPEGESQLWVPLESGYPEASEARGAHFLTGVARLAPEATLPRAQRELDGIAQRLAAAYPAQDRDLSLPLVPLQERVTREYRSTLLLLFGAVALLLLVACANFGGLLLARGAASQHELAVRAALGASRARIVQQLVAQSALLALAGGAAAVLLASWCLPALLALVPSPAFAGIALDRRVLCFALAASLATGILVGLLSAAQASRVDLHAALQAASPSHAGRTRLRSTLVVIEIALAVVLLTGAGLVLRGVWQLGEVRLGLDPAQVLTLRVDL
ncbi:MAG TPA: ABC transporter permease, partial [Myxococcales bacterium]|nr:ABC transporter permease [Myxococcales bacterium]